MVFTTHLFVFYFLPLVLLCYYGLLAAGRGLGATDERNCLVLNAFLLLASYVFYGWWDWRFVFLLAGSTLVNHVLALAIHRAEGARARKSLLASAVAVNLGLLAYFKYAGFFLSSAENMLSTLGLGGAIGAVSVVLPVGISFFTFMAISYVVDVYRG